MTEPNWIDDELAHVRELVERGMVRSESDAEAWLRELNVVCVAGIFGRRALLRALKTIEANAPTANTGDPFVEPDVEEVLGVCLAPFGIKIVSYNPGKSTVVSLATDGRARVVTSEKSGVGDLVIPSMASKADPVTAQVHVAQARRDGIAYFLCSGIHKPSPPLRLLVLMSERRFWIARRDELGDLHDELWKNKKGKPGARRYHGSGFAPHGERRGYLRVWVGSGGLALIEPHLRIGDDAGVLQWRHTKWLGGRER